MSSVQGLFERLRDPNAAGQRSVQQRADRVYSSVLHHLARLLNTREGESACVPGYGLPALTDIDTSARADDLRRAIERAIAAFEPRLNGARVKLLPPDPAEPLKLRFEVSGRIVTEDERLSVRFSTVADSALGWKISS
ncbi:MAG: type VI secretion system baseplate subunit TssE [Myxococcota bacterium]